MSMASTQSLISAEFFAGHAPFGNFDHFNISLKNDFFYSEKRHESRNSFLFNDAKLKLSYFPNSYYFKLQYGNRWFDEDNTRILTISGNRRNYQTEDGS